MNARADVEVTGFEAIFIEGADALRPDPPYTVSEWADKNRVLASVASAEPGPWRTSRTPYLKDIMDDLSAYSDVESVAVMKGAQLGVSEAALNFAGYAIHHSPGPMLYVMPTIDMMKKISKTRVEPMITASPALSDRIKPARSRDSGNTLLSKDFDGGTLLMTGANSASGLRSMPIRYVMLDEVDGYPASADEEGDPVVLAIKRTSTFVRRKIFQLSTPKIKGTSRIGKAFRAGDQRYYNVTCDACGTLQPITWAQIKWDDADASTARFECAVTTCRHAHYEHRKGALLAAGEWIPTAKPSRPGLRSYHLSGLYSPWFRWSEAVQEFLDAKGDPALLQPFVNTVLGEEWDDLADDKVDSSALFGKREDYSAGAASELEEPIPPGVAVITAGVDVQPDRLEIEVVGWGRDEESWSLDYQVFVGDPSDLDVWDQLDDYLEDRWPHAASDKGLRIAAVAIDTGGSNTHAVYNYVRPREGRRIWGIKGYAGSRPVWPKRPSRKNKGKINLFPIGVDSAKEIIYARLTKAGPLASGAGACHFPLDRDEEYFDQLTAEVQKKRYVRGVPVMDWVSVRERNEALDCRVYAYAALQGLAISGASLNREASKIEKALAAKGFSRPDSDESPDPEPKEIAVEEAANLNQPRPTLKPRAAPVKKKRRGVIRSRY